MRILTVSTALALALSASAALAQEGETASSSGCGVGTILFEGQKGAVPQILAVTTNGSFGNQTFGITTGTLGCTKDGVVRSPTKVRMLMMSSLDNLAVDMARGEGETLDSMADLMGVAPADKPRLFAALQSNFGSIFPNQDVTGEDVIASINQVLTEDAALSQYVII